MRIDKKKWKISIVLLFLISSFFFIFGFPPTLPSKRVEAIINSNHGNIKTIKLSPLKYIRVKNNLVGETIIIDNDFMPLVLGALSKSKKYDSVHPKAIWNCVIEIVNDKGGYKTLIKKTEKEEILMDIYSCGEWGLHLGEYKSDELGSIIENYLGKIKH